MDTVEARLKQAGIPFDTLTLPEKHASAAALGYPAAYVGRTVYYDTDNGLVAVVFACDAEVDPDLLAPATGCDRPRPVPRPAEGEDLREIWDLRLRRAPMIVLPGDKDGQAIKVDGRLMAGLDIEVADVARPRESAKSSAYDTLLERGFIDRVTSEKLARERLGDPQIAAYVGFDPSADSLHVGSLVPIMALAHVQRAGGRIIAVVGGGTGMIGDPSDRTELRSMLTREEIERNMAGLRRQLAGYLDIDDDRHLMLNNADWLADKNYIDFLREVGVHFSVNRMIAAECFRSRLEKGLSFIEFNYMLLQAYDFALLARERNCKAQMGGSDQWGNICAGIDLGRRMNGEQLVGVTFPLLMSASGRKFGKTEAGNVWLDPARTLPHDFFQFWRNADDLDVARFMGLFTFVPMQAVYEMCDVPPGPALNEAKKVLAFAATRLLHGEKTALECLRTAEALFGGVSTELCARLVELGLLDEKRAADPGAPAEVSGLPTLTLAESELESRGAIPAVLVGLALCSSRSEVRRLMAQGGVYLNDEGVSDPRQVLTADDFVAGEAMLRVGKKKHGRVLLAP